VCALLIGDADDPVQVTIVPRGGSGGVTWLVTNDDLLVSGAQARARLVVAMGGRAAEEIFLNGDFTSGASDDYIAARVLATHMVTRFGMSPNGVAYVGLDPTQMLPDVVHRAVNDILEDSLSSARALLHASGVLLRAIAEELLDEDTLKGARLRELRLAFEPVSVAVPTTGEHLRSYSTRVDE
jgi:cell division protease FtsH